MQNMLWAWLFNAWNELTKKLGEVWDKTWQNVKLIIKYMTHLVKHFQILSQSIFDIVRKVSYIIENYLVS
jgi:hypothetical protein